MAKNFCSNCGERLSSEDQFCGSCGQNLGNHVFPETEIKRETSEINNKHNKKKVQKAINCSHYFGHVFFVGGLGLLLGDDDNSTQNKNDGFRRTEFKSKRDKVLKDVSDLVVDDLLNNYHFYFVSEGYEGEEINNPSIGEIRIAYDDGLYYMDFFEFTDHISTQIEYKNGSIAGSLHTETVDMDIVGVVEIIDGRIVLSGTMIYENYEMQNMFAGSWSTSKTKT